MIEFANLTFKGLKIEDVLSESDDLKFIVTVNSEFIVKGNEDRLFRHIINENIATLDGQIPYFLAKSKHPNVEIHKLSGSDLIYDFCRMAKKESKSIFLLGGEVQSNKGSVERLRLDYQISVAGFSPEYKPYPFERKHNQLMLDRISKFKPDILFVGFGAIKQEFWIDDNKEYLSSIGVKWVIGSGGTFEMVSGKSKRAPKLLQSLGLEGVYRLVVEPKWFRIRRLLISFKVFKYIVNSSSKCNTCKSF